MRSHFGPCALLAVLIAVLGSCKTRSPSPSPSAPSTAAEPAVGEPEADPGEDFLEHLDASHTTVVHIADPLPHLQRMFSSPLFERLTRDPAVLAAQTGEPFTAQSARDSLAKMEPWIPTGLALGTDGEGSGMFVRALRSVLLMALCEGAFMAGEDAIAQELPKLQQQLAAEIEALRMPSLVLWSRMRGPQSAATVFENLDRALERLPEEIDVQRAGASFTLDLSMSAFLGRSDATAILVNVQLLTGFDDPMAERMVDAVLSLRGQVSLTRYGSVLVLELGPTVSPEHSTLPRRALGSLFEPQSDQMAMWAQWDLRSVRRFAAENAAVLEQWQDTRAGRAMLAADDEDFAGDIRDIDRLMASTMLRGQLRFDVDSTLRVHTIGEDPPAALPLEGSALLDLIPADSAWTQLDGTSGAGQVIADMLTRFEDRLARNGLKALVKGEDDSKTENLTRAYYGPFGRMRQLLLREGPPLFDAPSAFMLSGADSMPGIEVGLGPQRSPMRLSIRVPIPEFAFIGKPRDISKVRTWIEASYREFVQAMYVVSDERLPRSPRLISSKDLGLGVPTHVFHLRWLDRLTDEYRIEPEPGVGLHYFEYGDYLVLSTSTRLSRAILRSDDPALTLPRASLVAYGQVIGETVARFVIAYAEGMSPRSDGFLARARSLGAMARAVDQMTWRSWDEGDERHSSFTVTFAAD